MAHTAADQRTSSSPVVSVALTLITKLPRVDRTATA